MEGRNKSKRSNPRYHAACLFPELPTSDEPVCPTRSTLKHAFTTTEMHGRMYRWQRQGHSSSRKRSCVPLVFGLSALGVLPTVLHSKYSPASHVRPQSRNPQGNASNPSNHLYCCVLKAAVSIRFEGRRKHALCLAALAAMSDSSGREIITLQVCVFLFLLSLRLCRISNRARDCRLLSTKRSTQTSTAQTSTMAVKGVGWRGKRAFAAVMFSIRAASCHQSLRGHESHCTSKVVYDTLAGCLPESQPNQRRAQQI